MTEIVPRAQRKPRRATPQEIEGTEAFLRGRKGTITSVSGVRSYLVTLEDESTCVLPEHLLHLVGCTPPSEPEAAAHSDERIAGWQSLIAGRKGVIVSGSGDSYTVMLGDENGENMQEVVLPIAALGYAGITLPDENDPEAGIPFGEDSDEMTLADWRELIDGRKGTIIEPTDEGFVVALATPDGGVQEIIMPADPAVLELAGIDPTVAGAGGKQ